MVDLAESSRPIDMITLIEELDRHKELQAIGDVAYLSSLMDGVPDRPSIEHYVKIVRDKALLRGLITSPSTAIARAIDQSDSGRRRHQRRRSGHLPALGEAHWARLHGRAGDCPRVVRFGRRSAARGQRITGLATHYNDLDELTSGLQRSDLVIIAARPSMGKTAFAMNIAENAAIEDQQGGRSLLAGNVARGAADAHALFAGARRLPTNCVRGRCGRTTRRKSSRAMEQLAHAQSSSTTRPAFH